MGNLIAQKRIEFEAPKLDIRHVDAGAVVRKYEIIALNNNSA